MSLKQIISDLEQNIFLPHDLIASEGSGQQYKCKVKYDIVDDAAMLQCGCILSEALYKKWVKRCDGRQSCPLCFKSPSVLVGPIGPLRNLYHQLHFFKEDKAEELVPMRKKSSEQQSLLSLFHSVASKLNNTAENIVTDAHSLDNVSNAKTMPIQDSRSTSIPITTTPSQPSVQISQLDEEKEFYFAKCFPMYRKRSQFNTHPKFLRTRSKLFINTAISPDCTKFALITEHKWEVYSIPLEHKRHNDHSSKTKDSAKRFIDTARQKKEHMNSGKEPELLFCGKSSGEFGPNFDKLSMPSDLRALHPIYAWDDSQISSSSAQSPDSSFHWEHLYCKLSDKFLVISGSKGHFRVFDLLRGGEPIYTYGSTFPIRCIDIDPQSSVIACGITGNDRASGAEQALILFHKIERDTTKVVNSFDTDEIHFPPPITITLPYRDPINTLQFSPDSAYLSCSTALESRFLVISLRKINEPRLVMKSLRSIDTSLESEGITDTKIFPGNSNLMCVTSVAFNAPPIVINTKIQTINGVQTVAQPTMLLRLDELGSKIHKCEISPRNDSIAFLDRNGTVYIMYAPTLLDNEKRRIVAVEEVANAYRMREAASLRFSADGHRLYLLDRKGTLYVEDFAYGLPQDHEVTKCKQIN